jgi:hypothetical protein
MRRGVRVSGKDESTKYFGETRNATIVEKERKQRDKETNDKNSAALCTYSSTVYTPAHTTMASEKGLGGTANHGRTGLAMQARESKRVGTTG